MVHRITLLLHCQYQKINMLLKKEKNFSQTNRQSILQSKNFISKKVKASKKENKKIKTGNRFLVKLNKFLLEYSKYSIFPCK